MRAALDRPQTSTPGFVYERLGALRPGDVFWVPEKIRGREYLTSRLVLDSEFTDVDLGPCVLFCDDERRYLVMKKEDMVEVVEPRCPSNL